ncbi:unnamed protein product [Phaedon cochleariae]|uniref:Uncharacterized protein n=1 Tax=Phaedon cochleariae TaxID=80249 RepID=A0A9N9X258_PHACE|nr:unnamed protein product [Phaedon cochleariae]
MAQESVWDHTLKEQVCIFKFEELLPADKTQACLFSRKADLTVPNISLSGVTIPLKTSISMLDITISNNLSWENHLFMIYKAQIRPVLEYCSHIWSAAPKHTLKLLNSVQKWAISLVGDASLTKLTHFSGAPTKWKRQTAVGLELLAEAGNYAAFQRLYGAPAYGCWYPPQGAGAVPAAAPSAADLYYRQAAAAAAATLQKPLPYRLYPPGMGLGIPGPSAHLGTLAASSSLSTLGSYYSAHTSEGPSPRSPSPDTPLDPGSPGTGGRHSPSEDEDTIHV